jgi:hypothetical protein
LICVMYLLPAPINFEPVTSFHETLYDHAIGYYITLMVLNSLQSTGTTWWHCNWDSSVVQCSMIGSSRPGRGWKFFSPPLCPDWLWVLPSLLSNGYQGLFPSGKAAVHEAGCSPSSNAKVNNVWSYTSTPPIRIHGIVLN